jgi:hypothetical protein
VVIDYFAIALTHGLIALAAWRLMTRDDLDSDAAEAQARPERPWLKRRDG